MPAVHCNAVFHLLQDNTVLGIGHLTGNFHATVNGARVHDHNWLIMWSQGLTAKMTTTWIVTFVTTLELSSPPHSLLVFR